MLAITELAAATDTGLHRHANEDSYLVQPPVFVVADGMGGAQAGEVASQLATEAFYDSLGPGRPEQLLRDRIEGANAQIHRLARSDPSLAGMGTTLTAAVLVPGEDEIVIGHVGDSRVYRLRQGKLEQLTRDHSLVEEMRRKGQITEEQAETHPQRSIITRALGPEPVVEVDVQTVPVIEGDTFLLCSDGLTTMVDARHLESLVVSADSLETAVETLIAEANRAGGRDNITAVLFRVGESSDENQAALGAVATAGSRSRPAMASEPRTVVGASARAEGLDGNQIRAAARSEESKRRSEKGRRRAWGRVIKSAVALVLVAGLAYAALWGARQVWFLGTDEGGRVALYQGLPFELPFGIELYSERYSIPIQTDSLPAQRRESVTGHDMRSHEDAVSLINDILASEAPAPSGSGTADSPSTETGGATEGSQGGSQLRPDAGGQGGQGRNQGTNRQGGQQSGQSGSGNQRTPNRQ